MIIVTLSLRLRALRKFLCWRSNSVVCSRRPCSSVRGQSSADVHSSSQVRRHGTGCRAPFATLRPWTVSRRRWKHFSSLLTFNSPFLILVLLHALYERLCTAPLNRLPCYGALEVIVTLLLLLLLLFISCFGLVISTWKWLVRKTPVRTPNCGEITSTKPRLKRLFVSILSFGLLCPTGWGHNALMAVVCLSVCPVPDPKSVDKWRAYRKLKIGRKEACDLWPHLEIESQRSR